MIAAVSLWAFGLACLGLYALLAYRLSTRIEELAIRMALGAERRTMTPVHPVAWFSITETIKIY
jgi:hypothetical protein